MLPPDYRLILVAATPTATTITTTWRAWPAMDDINNGIV